MPNYPMAQLRNGTSIPLLSLTIQDFCAANRISLSTYRKLKAQDLGPVEMRNEGLVRISIEAAENWRRERENPTGRELLKRDADRLRLSERAKVAADAAVLSPKHVSNAGPRKHHAVA